MKTACPHGNFGYGACDQCYIHTAPLAPVAPQPPALGGEHETFKQWWDSLANKWVEPSAKIAACQGFSFAMTNLAPLQAEIERWKSLAANQADLTCIAVKIAKELRDELDQLKARSDELEGLLRSALEDSLDIEVLRMMRGSVYVSRLSDRIKAALSKPAGSEQV